MCSFTWSHREGVDQMTVLSCNDNHPLAWLSISSPPYCMRKGFLINHTPLVRIVRFRDVLLFNTESDALCNHLGLENSFPLTNWLVNVEGDNVVHDCSWYTVRICALSYILNIKTKNPIHVHFYKKDPKKTPNKTCTIYALCSSGLHFLIHRRSGKKVRLHEHFIKYTRATYTQFHDCS